MNKHLRTILIITGAVCGLGIILSVVFTLVYMPILRENNKVAQQRQEQERNAEAKERDLRIKADIICEERLEELIKENILAGGRLEWKDACVASTLNNWK